MALYESKLTKNEIERYSRQVILQKIGVEGQIKLREVKILVVGLGGLGSPVCQYLASSGVGEIGLLDYDTVELHNLNRQIIHTEKFIGKSKVKSAYSFIKSINSTIKINSHDEMLTENNVTEIFCHYDIILDCTDDIFTRYLINDYCVILKKRLVSASVLKFEGQVFVFGRNKPCYRCLFPEIKNITVNCDEAGVVGAVCGIIGSIQANEAIKITLNIEKTRLITYNALNNDFDTFKIKSKKKCLVCQKGNINELQIIKKKAPPMFQKMDDQHKIQWKNYLENKDEYVLIDIRDENSFKASHITGSYNVPAEKILKNTNVVEQYNKKLVILCRRGISAASVAKSLLDKGIDCLVLEGGLTEFKKSIDKTFDFL
ncbi:hypothetical protein COBT_001104 [Conglomerata obtusa]